MSSIDLINTLFMSGEGGGKAESGSVPPETSEYLLTPDGDILVSPDGVQMEDI